MVYSRWLLMTVMSMNKMRRVALFHLFNWRKTFALIFLSMKLEKPRKKLFFSLGGTNY